jgi:hypothetical protein
MGRDLKFGEVCYPRMISIWVVNVAGGGRSKTLKQICLDILAGILFTFTALACTYLRSTPTLPLLSLHRQQLFLPKSHQHLKFFRMKPRRICRLPLCRLPRLNLPSRVINLAIPSFWTESR